MLKIVSNHRIFRLNKCNSTTNYQFRNFSNDDSKHPIRRTLRILGNDMRKVKNFFISYKKRSEAANSKDNDLKYNTKIDEWSDDSRFQTHCDVLIIGGGGFGSSTAYWLKKKVRDGLNVVVLEHQRKKPYPMLPYGGFRQQFLQPENIQMSLFGADFIRKTRQGLGNIKVNFVPNGFLLLANDDMANEVKQMSSVQNELGAKSEILARDRLKAKFPWLCTKGIELGCHGFEKMGWFDPWGLLMQLKFKAKEYGAHFVNAEVIDFEFQSQPDIIIEGGAQREIYNAIDKAVVKMPNNEIRTIKFAICVIAAGSNSSRVARLARIGNGSGILSIPLPVGERQYCNYTFKTESFNAPGLCTPYTICSDGINFLRRDISGNYIAGCSTPINLENEKISTETNEFENNIRPKLTQRVSAFESAKLCSTSVSDLEYNYFDGNGIVGPHAYYNNLYIATGFGMHGIQQAPAVGRAISELIIDGQFRTIDLTRLGFDRIVVRRPVVEPYC